jgi:hypothetical protein
MTGQYKNLTAAIAYTQTLFMFEDAKQSWGNYVTMDFNNKLILKSL